MRYILDKMRRFFKDEKKVLGRWNLEQCNKKTNHKIDLSNIDHCGPCGNYLLNTTLPDVHHYKNKIKK